MNRLFLYSLIVNKNICMLILYRNYLSVLTNKFIRYVTINNNVNTLR